MIVEKQTARELFDYVLAEGRKDLIVQRYKGLGEMTAPQLWDTTMDPERRTLLSVKLEDLLADPKRFSPRLWARTSNRAASSSKRMRWM